MSARKEETPTQTAETETTFTCKFCQRTKPLSDMTVVDRFFPPVIACRACARKLR